MADFIHMTNIIQGEVIRITERRPLKDQLDLLDELEVYLRDQAVVVTIMKLRVKERLDNA